MIDSESRKSLAKVIQLYIASKVDIDECVDQACDIADSSDDPGIRIIADETECLLHLDSTEEQNWADKVIAFLHSDCRYEWPKRIPAYDSEDGWFKWACGISLYLSLPLIFVFPFIGLPLLSIPASPFLYSRSSTRIDRVEKEWRDRCSSIGEVDSWPFIRQSDYIAAKNQFKSTITTQFI